MKPPNPASKPTAICLAIVTIFCSTGTHSNADIIYPKPPEKGREIVLKNIDLKFLGVSNIEELTIAAPYQCYAVDLNDLASGHLLSAARLLRWCYPLVHAEKAVGAAYLDGGDKTGKAPAFNSINKPYYPNGPLEALQYAETLPQIKKKDYEVRYLDIVSVKFFAIWLHAKSDDIIIQISLVPPPPKAYMAHSEAEILKLLQKQAQWEQKTYKNDNGESGGKGG